MIIMKDNGIYRHSLHLIYLTLSWKNRLLSYLPRISDGFISFLKAVVWKAGCWILLADTLSVPITFQLTSRYLLKGDYWCYNVLYLKPLLYIPTSHFICIQFSVQILTHLPTNRRCSGIILLDISSTYYLLWFYHNSSGFLG